MLKQLLINDLKYYWFVFMMMSLPLIIFTILGLTDTYIDLNMEFINKYFWSLVIGLGSYFLIYGMHVNKYKEKHDRVLAYLPVPLKNRAIYKFAFGIFPIVSIVFFLEFLRTILPDSLNTTITRIDAQLSLLFIFLGIMSTSYDYMKCPTKKIKHSIRSASIVIILSLLSAGFIILVGSETIPPIVKGRDEIYFYLWGIVIAVVASVIYYRRESFV